MEKFEYGEEKLEYEKRKERALAGGLKQYQIYSTLIPEDFGLEINNNFPELSSEDLELLESLYNDRDVMVDTRDQIIRVINPLIDREKVLSSKIDKINKKICNIQGHRLDEESLHLTGAYSHGYICLVCGQFIKNSVITDKDVLVKKPDGPKRIRYKK